MSHEIEILPPSVKSRSEAQFMIRSAISDFKTAKRATIKVMAHLRRLQDGQVHTLYGYKNFADWAENTFDGLSAGNIRQLCRAGSVVLELQKRDLLDKDKPDGIGTTGLRELSVISGTYGSDKMIKVFNTCKEISKDTGKDISAATVESAMRLLMPAANIEPETIDEANEPDEPDDDDIDASLSPKAQEIVDRIRDLAYDLPDDQASKEMEDALKQLNLEMSGADSTTDQQWIDSSR